MAESKDIFTQLSERAAERGLKFVVIGGHAVIHYGVARATVDVDILIQKETAGAWRELLAALGYKLFHDGGTFLQMEAKDTDSWDIDLMLVNERTFVGIAADASPADFEGTTILIPSLAHLLALKFHALKYAHTNRVLKDLDDAINLVRLNRIDPGSEWFRALALKYGTRELYDQILRQCSAG